MKYRLFLALALSALATVATPTRLMGQVFSVGGKDDQPLGPRRSPVFGGAALVYGRPQSDFRNFVNQGFGIDGSVHYKFDRQGIFSLGLEGGFLTYGRETMRVPLSTTIGGRILVDVTTSNNILWAGVGPQLTAPSGPVRPYIGATAGFSYFFTESSVEGSRDDFDDFAKTTNYDDATFAWTGGGGLLIPVGNGVGAIDIGARYHANGNVRYLRRGSIVDLPNGDIEITPVESRAPLLSWRLGFRAGLR